MNIVVRFGMCMLFFWLLACSTGLAETKRATEELLGKPYKSLKQEISPSTHISPQEKEKKVPVKTDSGQVSHSDNRIKAPVKSDSAEKRKINNEQKAVGSAFQIKLQDCFYNQNTQSVVCKIQMTSQLDVSAVVLYCYSGTGAVDSNKNSLQCNEVQLGQDHSWQYVLAKLDKDVPVNAEINLQAASPVTSILELKIVMSVNGQRQTIQMTNVAVH